MDNTWNKLYDAAKQVLNPREISKMIEAGGVAAAIESTSGKIYVGVCVDTACTCREFMTQLMPDSYRTVEIMMDYETNKVVTLSELTPKWWI